MEAQFGSGRGCHYGSGAELELNLGKKSYEWDLNNWNWDGELFLARPTNGNENGIRIGNGNWNGNVVASNSSSSCSEENGMVTMANGQSQSQIEAEKRRRVVVEEDNGLGSLSLRVGANPVEVNGNGFVASGEERDSKKGKVAVQAGNSTRPVCQVDGCEADLTGSKDYHRRHKVCEMHAKASTAVIGNMVQRFCQQCSRFHLLEEFDEGKRSCRRRLAGHNKRRRKTQPDAAAALGSVAGALDEKTTSYLIISLLRILTGLHSNNTDPSKEQDLTTHLLKNLINLAGSTDVRSLLGLLQPQSQSQSPEKAGTSTAPSSDVVTNHMPPAEVERSPLPSSSRAFNSKGSPGERNSVSVVVNRNTVSAIPEPAVCQPRLRDFDLNDACNDTQAADGAQTMVTVACNDNGSPTYPAWMTRGLQQHGPQQASGNSDSLSTQSLSSSNGDAQCRTDRIVFKLFGKDPHDFPIGLRDQIFNWLNNTPTDVESHIKPGCIILTIYLRLPESKWTELCKDFSSEIERLLNNCTDDFWQTGWIYVRIQHEIVFAYNGQVIIDTTVPLGGTDYSKILCVRPVAVPYCNNVKFEVKGFNLVKESMRLFCSFEGRQLFEDNARTLAIERHDSETQHGGPDHLVTLNFSCSTLDARGRGFIEVEEHGFSNGFFPFIVAEKEVCSEIRALEDTVDVPTPASSIPRDEAFKFLNELGWLLRKSQALSLSNNSTMGRGAFQLTRFEWLVQFAINRDWCHVVKMLLDILFTGAVDLGGKDSPREVAVSMNLLFDAVRRNCRGMVETLLRYSFDGKGYIFRPDASGPLELTPLHTAASRSGAEGVIDALTSDPNMVGLKAWKTVKDGNNQTPEDYARERCFNSYQQLVQKKLDQQLENPHVVIGIPEVVSKSSTFDISSKVVVPPPRQYCNLCTRQAGYSTTVTRTFLYRPALLTMVGIAAVCVCVGILLHTPPKVRFVVPSFRWELLDFGAI